MEPCLDVVIVNHRTPILMAECVESVDHYLGHLGINIITVDNSPADEAVGEHVIPNLGYGQACNHGVSLGGAPYLLVLNADVKARPDSNPELCLKQLDLPRVAVVGPKQVNPEGWIASAGCPPADNGVGYTIRGWREQDRGQYSEEILDCIYVAGSVVFSRRDVWDELGGFLETPLYYEESFYCYKARHRGYRVVYNGQCVWTHHWDASPKNDQHLLSGRPISRASHAMFVEACRREGIPDAQIPPFV